MPTENIPEEAGPCPFKVPWIPMDPIWPFHPLTHRLQRDWPRMLCQPKMDPHLLDVPLYLDILISLFVCFNRELPWHPQILTDQLTLSQPGGTDYSNDITTRPHGFWDLPWIIMHLGTQIDYHTAWPWLTLKRKPNKYLPLKSLLTFWKVWWVFRLKVALISIFIFILLLSLS